MFETEFWMGLLTIIAIDLVLAGDNAVVIAMASRNLPLEQRKRAVLWGTIGAVGVRIIMTLIAVWLLKIPLLQAIGGILLVFVAIKLLTNEEDTEKIKAGSSLRQAIQTIIVADVIMGLDNVLAIAGAAHGNMLLVVLGLAVSVPIVIWGSQWISSFMNRYPVIVYIGAGILAWTAGSMIIHDKVVQTNLVEKMTWLSWLIPLLTIILVIGIGKLKEKKSQAGNKALESNAG